MPGITKVEENRVSGRDMEYKSGMIATGLLAGGFLADKQEMKSAAADCLH